MKVVRSLVILAGLVLFAAVSGVYADQIGGRSHEDTNYIKIEPAAVYHTSLHPLPVAAVHADSMYGTFGENHESWRIRGIRDGQWLKLSFLNGWKNDDGDDNNGSSDPPTPSTVATPEPGTLLLLGAGLFIARRRVRNA